jgi:hypothetical protein
MLEALLFAIFLILAMAGFGAAAALAKRVGVLVPSAFVVAYVLGVGAILLVNIGVLQHVDPKFRVNWVSAWRDLFWPLWTIFYSPTAASALLACWFSRPSTRKSAISLLGLYLILILVAIQIAWVIDANLSYVLGAFVLLGAIFFAMAGWKRAANSALDNSSPLHGSPRP